MQRGASVKRAAARVWTFCVRIWFSRGTDRVITLIAMSFALSALLGVSGTVNKIQQSRKDNTLIACRDQNARHDRTIITLDTGLLSAIGVRAPNNDSADAVEERTRVSLAAVPGTRADQLRQTHDFTVLLIDALAPKQNCDALVRARVK